MFHRYASDDAIGHLRCLNKLLDMPDLTRRLRVGQDVVGLKVDITPLNGSLACMATCAATAIIQEPAAIEPPQGIKATFSSPETGMAVVKIDRVFSPSLIVPGTFKSTATGRHSL